MNELFIRIYIQIQSLLRRNEGQDLVEYALLITLISLAALTGVRKVASAVSIVFSNVSATL
jgi:pilus assembly protein Flp/PilA